jgi:NAD(P)-dependent dehydrogenase (short-subunit alcohol dehydrogenase family)
MLNSRGEECRTVASSIPNAQAFPGDVGNPDDVRSLFAYCRETFGHLDLLVNSAGVAQLAPLSETSDEMWESTLRTNLTGLFFCCREAAKMMAPRHQGHIINVLSVASFEVFPGNAAYCASKFGALGMTRVLREELRASKIRVTALMPGPTDTPLWEGYWPDAPREAMMQPDDVARVVLAAIADGPKAMMEEIVLRPMVGGI